MANTINLFKETDIKSINSSSILGENQVTKDKPSLFDSLLSNSLVPEEEVSTNSDVKKDVNSIDVKTNNKVVIEDNVEVDEIKSKIDSSLIDSKIEVKSTSSLLDRLILEAKKDVKTISSEEDKSLNNKINIDNLVKADKVVPEEEVSTNSDVKKDVNSIDVKTNNKVVIEDNVEVDETKSKIDSSLIDSKIEVKSTSSLLDRLILEAKKDVKTISSEEDKSLNNKINIDNLVKADKVVPEEEVSTNSDVKKDVNSIDVKTNNKVVIEDNVEVDETKSKIDSSLIDSKIEVKSTSSLLDRLILEAKKDVKTISSEEDKSLNNKINIDNLVKADKVVPEEEVSTNSDVKKDVNSIDVKTNNKVVIEDNVEVDETKSKIDSSLIDSKIEVKSTSSLLDRLILEAKKDVKTISSEEDKSLNNKINIDNLVKADKVVPEEEVSTNSDVKIISTAAEKNLNTKKNINVSEKEEIASSIINVLNNTTIVSSVEDSAAFDINNKLNTPNNIFNTLNDEINLVNINNLGESITKIDKTKSLMDQLIQNNSAKNGELNSFLNIDTIQKDDISKDLISNIYLSSQRNSMNNQALFNKNEAISLLKDGTSVNNIKVSAEMLDLGLETIDIDQNLEVQQINTSKKIDIDFVSRKNLLDTIMFEKNIKSEDLKGLITKSVEASSALLENNLELADDGIVNVNSPLSYNIQSKIIGAKQQMSTMMSDIAKQMYENYKPPVTAFKINLNPLELGSIAILMKSDKNNALSISMNVSNNATLDALIDNQNILRNSLNKTFDENTKFNLDFASSNENNNQPSSQNEQGKQKKFEQQIDTQSVLKLKEENKDREEKSIDYM